MEVIMFWLAEGADGFRVDAINHLYESEFLLDEEYINLEGDLTRYDNLVHSHTMNEVQLLLSSNASTKSSISFQPESYEFIFNVRKVMDDYAMSIDNITRFLMTEAYATIPLQIGWYGLNSTIKGSHMPFNFAMISELNQNSKAAEFKQVIDTWIGLTPTWGTPNWVLGNHDRSRVGSRYGADRHEGLAIMTMMLPGINVIYYVRTFLGL